jgi:hypothetical protein
MSYCRVAGNMFFRYSSFCSCDISSRSVPRLVSSSHLSSENPVVILVTPYDSESSSGLERDWETLSPDAAAVRPPVPEGSKSVFSCSSAASFSESSVAMNCCTWSGWAVSTSDPIARKSASSSGGQYSLRSLYSLVSKYQESGNGCTYVD